ncbi:putative endoplasmic reticulum-resident kdel protein [Stachybotrys elegans]|uniref:Endoplasmic reticulum-resident kdel protein n=1 Tax=Stachybotrys elegans TaxID=80388 RepID=A0A8K0WV49_9HYPO|nr:putative endoplasmic reticulum-resident kdel protein [Stachybotrys elegans]
MLKRWNLRVWPSRLLLRYLVVAALFVFFVTNYTAWDHIALLPARLSARGPHPIQKLMADAVARHEELLAKRSYDLETAAARYRERRGRHPPPGFDRWFQATVDHDAILVEDYFDRIYKDLAPFWGLDREVLVNRANTWDWVVRVRNGIANGDGNTTDRVPWLQLWTKLVDEFAVHLPDVDMPINYMDEPRLLVPHDEIAKLVEKEQKTRAMPPPNRVTSKYIGLAGVDASHNRPYRARWYGTKNAYWNLAVAACGPDTPAYGVKAVKDFSAPAEMPHDWQPDYAYHGFIQNWTASMDPCLQPHLRQLHGSFIEPLSLSTTKELIPLFGGSKLMLNNEILIPGAMYLTDDEFYSGGESHGPEWSQKRNGLVWRGDASGGRSRNTTWHHFQRHRLIDMLNHTTVSRMEARRMRAKTFELPSPSIYHSSRRAWGRVGSWLREFADVGFVHLCPPNECDFLPQFFAETPSKPMSEQYEYKFLPDADGNSFSARFRGFMRSTSLPLKATIYAEWHDDRLIPWLHFAPLDNTFQDLYAVLEYLGDNDGPGDRAAAFMAQQGQEWAERVLRREDMKLYVWRLLLEWARLCDENRDTLGYVADLL